MAPKGEKGVALKVSVKAASHLTPLQAPVRPPPPFSGFDILDFIQMFLLLYAMLHIMYTFIPHNEIFNRQKKKAFDFLKYIFSFLFSEAGLAALSGYSPNNSEPRSQPKNIIA